MASIKQGRLYNSSSGETIISNCDNILGPFKNDTEAGSAGVTKFYYVTANNDYAQVKNTVMKIGFGKAVESDFDCQLEYFADDTEAGFAGVGIGSIYIASANNEYFADEGTVLIRE